MTVSPRAAHPSQPRISLAAVRSGIARSSLLCSSLLLMLFALFGGSALAQSLSPSGPVIFGPAALQQTPALTRNLNFFGPNGSVTTIGSISVVTEGVADKDFTLSSAAILNSDNVSCIGTPITFPTECTITIAFSPQQVGLRLGALVITDSAGAVINVVYLSGIGTGPQFVFQPATATSLATSGLAPANFTAGAAVQDPNGDTFFTDVANNRILEESSIGGFSVVFAGSPLNLKPTSGLAIDGAGNLYITSNSSVFVLAPGSTLPTALTIPDGIQLNAPTGLAIDNAGELYIADTTTSAVGTIYQDDLGGNFAQALPLNGVTLSGPTGLAIDDANNLYIADTGNNRIVEAAAGTFVPTVVNLTTLKLSGPTGVAVDAAGTIYIADTGNARIVEATAPTSTTPSDQFVLAFTATPPFTNLAEPASILIQTNGNLVVSDTDLGLVTFVRTTALVDFPTPTVVGTLDATDDPETLTVQGTGNIASTLEAGADPAFSGTDPTAFLLATTGTCPSLTGGAPTPADTFAIGQVCTYNLNFQPTVVGPNTANLVLTTAAAGGLTSTSTASLFGIGLNQLNHFTLVASTTPSTTPTTVDLGGSVELTLTAIQADGAVATDYTGTVTFTTSDPNGKYLSGTGAVSGTVTFTLTAADNGVLVIPMASGLQLNDFGIFTATAAADPATVPPGANGTAVSNQIFVVEPASITLTSSVNPSLVNQQTIFTLTVTTTGSVTPAGNVSFFNGKTLIGTGPVTLTPTSATTATASVPDTFTAAGSYPISAVYTSSSNTQGGTATLIQVVGVATTATLTSSVNPVAVNANTTLTATIKSATGTPTGTVTFKSDGVAIGTGTLNGGIATLVTSFNLPGEYTLVAVYNGDANNQGSTTNTVLETVLNAISISLTSSVNPIFLDNPTVLTATLTTAVAGAAPTGTVTFFDGSTPIGTGTVVNGVVSITASFVYAGPHTITAVYSGDAANATGTSPALAQTVADFSLAVASGGSSSATAIAGGTASYSLAVTPIVTATLPAAITLTVTGLPSTVTGTLTPASIAAGSGATPVTFAVAAASLLQAARVQPRPTHRSPLGYAPAALAFLLLPLAWPRRRKRFGTLLASLCLFILMTAGLTGCISTSSSGYYGQTPQTYNLTVTATSGNLSRSTYLTLTVQ